RHRLRILIDRVDVAVVIKCPPVPIRAEDPARLAGVGPHLCLKTEGVAYSWIAFASKRLARENALARSRVDRPPVEFSHRCDLRLGQAGGGIRQGAAALQRNRIPRTVSWISEKVIRGQTPVFSNALLQDRPADRSQLRSCDVDRTCLERRVVP